MSKRSLTIPKLHVSSSHATPLCGYPSNYENCSGVPAVHSLFTPYQAPPKKKNGRGAATSSHLPTDGRMPPAIPFMGHREPPGNMDGPPSNARRERDLKDPVQQSSGNSQSGSDEQQPSSSNASVEVSFSALFLTIKNHTLSLSF